MKKRNQADYIHSPDNIVYSSWRRWFAWVPVTTIKGDKKWLCTLYRRERQLLADIPQLPVGILNKTQYATLDEIIERKLQGLP